MFRKLFLLTFLCFGLNTNAQEIFADYFDITWGATQGAEVFGKINLKENKDFKTNPIPKDYLFKIIDDKSGLFELATEFDPKGRIFGVIKVKNGKSIPEIDKDFPLEIALTQKDFTHKKKTIVIHARKKTLWSQLRTNFEPYTTSITKLYGRFTYTDQELAATIDSLIKNDGKFSFSKMYGAHPSDYQAIKDKGNLTNDQRHKARDKGIEGDWKNVLKHIGGLGYAYAHSTEYGIPSKDENKQALLRKAIYLSLYQYLSNIAVDGNEIEINGKPVGPYTGDGIAMMDTYKLISHQVTTHQWELTDPLAAPLVHIMPYIVADKAKGDPLAEKIYYELKDYFQLFFAEVLHRREMDNFDGRWKVIADENYSNGAWSDANIGHRYRCLMLMPIVWADYNQPITYVEYWYDDFFDGTKFEGKQYAKFSPTGIISDLREISKLFSVPTQNYGQSGFNPDGTISHHCDEGSDVAMQDYGFHWLVNPLMEANYWKGSSKPIDPNAVQFIIDRYNFTYNNIIYKNRLDFTAIGRSHLANTKKFIETELFVDGEELYELIPSNSNLKELPKFKSLLEAIHHHKHTADTSMVFWNADLAVHRKESDGKNYYFSVKNKSVRSVGAEDFSEVRKSWHFGSGVFQLKVTGDEYEQIKLNKWDHHTVPGVTEEWRTDPMPLGHSAASRPGGNKFSGQLSDGKTTMAAYHHKPKDTYTSVNALKSYYMNAHIGTALGTAIKRVRPGQNENIVTTVDQNYFDSPIYYHDGNNLHELDPKNDHDLTIESENPIWIYQNRKGYLIFPKKNQNIFIKTNGKVNITNPKDSTFIKHYSGHYYLPTPKYGTAIIALDHGIDPAKGRNNGYHYALVADVKLEDMPTEMANYKKAYWTETKHEKHHAVYNSNTGTTQITFFDKSKVKLPNKVTYTTDAPCLISSQEKDNAVVLSVSNPLHTLDKNHLTITTNMPLKPGKYQYEIKGISPQKGEYFYVKKSGSKTIISVELPDSKDAFKYNYQEKMFAGAPLTVSIPKN